MIPARLAAALLTLSAASAPVAIAQGAAAQTVSASAFQTTTLNLSAYGEVRARPDMATISLGVASQAPSAAAAMRLNAQAMDATLRALKSQGITPRDIQTSNLSLNAQYVYEDKRPPRLMGYEASNQVSVGVRDLARLGSALDAVVGAGVNRINGVSFGLQDPQAYEDQARKAAVTALAGKAQLYAAATGYGIRRLVSLSEGGGYVPEAPQPMVMAMKAARFSEPSTPVEAGELKVRIDVNGLYELGR